jgi:hypothetical protein
MGGFGSGRYGFSSAGTCESTHSIESRMAASARHPERRLDRRWHDAHLVTGPREYRFDRRPRAGGRPVTDVRRHRSRRHPDQRRRARPLCIHADQVRRPAVMADVHQVRSILPQDLRRSLLPLPAMPPAEICLAERKLGPAHARRLWRKVVFGLGLAVPHVGSRLAILLRVPELSTLTVTCCGIRLPPRHLSVTDV